MKILNYLKHKSGMLLMLLGILFLSMQTITASAQQQKTITGTVVDDDGLSLIGVTVIVQGASTGIITDIDGHYSVTVPDAKSVLQFSFIGFLPKNVTVGNQTVINITLNEDTQMLDDVVVVGYGVQKKSHLTGSVSKLKGEGLDEIPVTRIDQALQGKIAGVNIQSTTPEAGVAAQIRIRGLGSLSAGGEPLVVVDGYPIAEGLSFVEASDVESIEVLKDAASAAIYGSRGANGVIMITTKGGNIKKPKYSFKTSHGLKTTYKEHDNLNYDSYIGLLYSEAALRAQDPSLAGTPNRWNLISNQERAEYIINTQIYGANTDWQSQALRDLAYIGTYQLGVSGGTKEVKYYLSGNYSTDEGMMYHNTYDKMNLRAKIDAQISKRVKVGINLNPTYSKSERPSINYTDFYRFRSWLPVKHTEETAAYTGQAVGSWAHPRHFSGKTYSGTMPDGTDWTSTGTLDPWSSQNNNPKSIMEGDTRKNYQYRLMTNAYLTVQIAKGLEFKTSDGVFYSSSKDKAYLSAGAKKEGEASQGTYKTSQKIDLLSENTLSYNTTFNKIHSLDAVVGMTYQKTSYDYSQLLGFDFPTDEIHTLNHATAFDASNTYTYEVSEALVSYLGRVNYAYKDKYLASASLRTDGSSRFGPGNRWSWFPSASLGWRVTEEPFMKAVPSISSLKLRASYGMTGNNNLPINTTGSNTESSYAYSNTFFPANYQAGKSGALAPGLATTSYVLGNPNITWERTNEYNYGIDMGLLKNRIMLNIEFYYSITDKLLLLETTPSHAGYNQYWNNAGKVRNSGLEIELATVNLTSKDFEWRTSVNFATNSNKLISLGGEPYRYNYGERNEMYAAIVGKSAIQFFGYKTDGVWLSDEDIAEAKKNTTYASGITTVAGGLKVVDTNKDGIVNADDRVAIGSPFPDFTWSMTNNFQYKNLDFSFMFQGVQGVDVINGDHFYTEVVKQNKAYIKNRWISPAFSGDGKTPYYTSGMDKMLTDFVVEDGSFTVLRDVQIGYKLPSKAVKKIGLQNLRIYGGAQNLLYIMASGYKGINPESRVTSGTYSSPLVSGYQRGGYPVQRTFNMGVDITF